MKNILFTLSAIVLLAFTSYASEHGIYLQTHTGIKAALPEVQKALVEKIESGGFNLIADYILASPDYIRQDTTEHCGYKAGVIVFASDEYSKMLTSYGNKYLTAGFLRIGIYETPSGINVSIADPETINRIIFNDLYENDQVNLYNEVIAKTEVFKIKLVSLLHSYAEGNLVETAMEPIRDNEDLQESSKDMFMMVGQMTFFNDEDQFPVIYSRDYQGDLGEIQKLKEDLITNLKSFTPVEDDIDYRWSPSKNDLQWKIVGEIESENKEAVLLGLSRPRTEAVSFNIAGSSREDESNMCPGIDHAAAYPIEVLIIKEDNKINVYTPREMFRMDMYFWDAGMSAFMDHMSMPGILDESIKKALLGKEYTEE